MVTVSSPSPNHSVNYHTLSQKLDMQETLEEGHIIPPLAVNSTSASPKRYTKWQKCFTISTAGLGMNNLFVSAQLIYFLSPAADRLFYPLLPPMTSKHQCCRICDNKTGVVYPQGENKTLAEHRTPFPLLFKYKDLQATLFIDQDNTSSHSESGATRRTATGNGMIK